MCGNIFKKGHIWVGWSAVQLLLAILLWNVASNSRRQLTAAVYTPYCDINWKHELFIVYTFKLKFVIMIFLYSFWMLYLSHWKWFPSSIGLKVKAIWKALHFWSEAEVSKLMKNKRRKRQKKEESPHATTILISRRQLASHDCQFTHPNKSKSMS